MTREWQKDLTVDVVRELEPERDLRFDPEPQHGDGLDELYFRPARRSPRARRRA